MHCSLPASEDSTEEKSRGIPSQMRKSFMVCSYRDEKKLTAPCPTAPTREDASMGKNNMMLMNCVGV